MKILELNLIAFGPFTGERIDLSAGQPGLHLVYGANEAGKSSSLRAISNFLFGFPRNIPDAFQHPQEKLRIGSWLQHSDGSELRAIRRKRGKTLRCENDKVVIKDEELKPFLDSVDQALFGQMFGINHDRLRSGGDEIGNADSQIGQLLFSASSGLQYLQKLRKGLQSEIDGLLTSSRRAGAIHKNQLSYQEHRKKVNDASVTVETWKRHYETLRSRRQKKQELDEQVRQKECELERLTRIQNAVAPIGRWKLRTESLQNLQSVPRLSDGFDRQASQTLIELRTAEQQQIDARSERKRIDKQLELLTVPAELLAEEEAIGVLRDRFGSYRKSSSDRPKILAELESFEREVGDHLLDLERHPDLARVEELRLPPDKSLRIQELGRKHDSLFERLQSHRAACEKLQREIELAERKMSSISISHDLTSLRVTLRSVQQKGDVEAECLTSQNELQQLRQQTELAIRQLPLWSGDLAELESLAVPTAATMRRFDGEFNAARQTLTMLSHQLDDEVKKQKAIDAEISSLEAGQSVPTQQSLDQWRELRQQGWQLILAEWKHGAADLTQVSEFLKHFSAESDLSTAYQHCVIETDRVADLLRTDAKRVATKSKLHSDRQRSVASESELKLKLASAQTDLRALEISWTELWAPLGVAPLTPDDMQAWLQKQESIVKSAESIRNKQQEYDQHQQTIETLSQRLSSSIQLLDPAVNLSSNSLQERSQWMSDKIDEMQSIANQRGQLKSNLDTCREELATAETQFQKTLTEMESFQTDWTLEMQALGLEKNALPSQANSRLTSIGSLFEKYKEVDRRRTQLEHIDRDARQFEIDVRQLIQRVIPDLGDQPMESAFQLLLKHLQDARSAAEKREGLREQKCELERRLKSSGEKVGRTKLVLDDLLRQARVSDYEELGEAFQQSRERQELEAAARELQDEIADYGAGATFEELVAEVELELAAEEPISLRIEQRQQSLKSLKVERDDLIRDVTSAQIELDAFDGSGLAIESHSMCESIAAQLEDQLRSLAALQVAAAVLNAGIEQHREKNQGPILGRAKEIFRRITLENFADLQVDYDDKENPVLVGIRGSGSDPILDENEPCESLFPADPGNEPANAGERVLVNGMSDGTRDQLYLALRLASLENWLDHHEPIPFIVDDVLMNFDDDRSIAALKVLAELSRRTQVIFFTHHQHLVELATKHLSKKDLFVTRITQ